MGSNLPIGVFDSGVGGLTVAKEIMNQLPDEKIIYFGDTARVPYGNKSKETVTAYSRQIVKFLMSKGVKAIVVACNTASAFALEAIKHEIDIPIIGVVKPEASPVRRMVQNAKDTERCLDATCGRKCKSVIVTENGYIVLSALLPETIAGRVNERMEQ